MKVISVEFIKSYGAYQFRCDEVEIEVNDDHMNYFIFRAYVPLDPQEEIHPDLKNFPFSCSQMLRRAPLHNLEALAKKICQEQVVSISQLLGRVA